MRINPRILRQLELSALQRLARWMGVVGADSRDRYALSARIEKALFLSDVAERAEREKRAAHGYSVIDRRA